MGKLKWSFKASKHLHAIFDYYKNYRIIYRVLESDRDIEILAVIHGARDLRSAFREDWDIE